MLFKRYRIYLSEANRNTDYREMGKECLFLVLIGSRYSSLGNSYMQRRRRHGLHQSLTSLIFPRIYIYFSPPLSSLTNFLSIFPIIILRNVSHQTRPLEVPYQPRCLTIDFKLQASHRCLTLTREL
jgi:hypothetical protein